MIVSALALCGAAVAGPFTAGNLAVLRAEASANNTTCSVVELNTTTGSQAPTNTIAIDGVTTPNELRFSGSATSTCYVSHSADGSLLTFTGVNSTDTSSNVNALNPRAVGTVNAAGTFALATTYTGTSGNQARSATSLNNTNWYISDQGGIYTNGTTSAVPAGNTRGIKSFGASVYVLQQSTAAAVVSTVSALTGGSLNGLTGLPADNTAQDFYMISSGNNGSTFDIIYILTTAGIKKYSLVSGSWTANGSYTGVNGFGLAAAKNGSGANLYLSTGTGATIANSVVKVNDTAGYNATINAVSAGNVTLYTAPARTIVKGLDFAPAANTPTITGEATAAAFTTTYGTASSPQAFPISGANLTANITATAAAGLEVSSDGTTFGASASFTQSGGSAGGSLRVRLSSTAAVTGSYNGMTVALTSTGATTVNITAAASGNSVTAKGLTITGVSASSKSYDGTNTATLGGTPAYAGLVNSQSFSVTGTPSAAFADAAVGTGRTVTVTGYTAPSSNYTVTQPSLAADITKKGLTLTANNVTKPFGNTLGTVTGSVAFTSSGLVSPETIGSVTITYGSGASAGDAAGTYLGSVTPSAATGGAFAAANYQITYVSGDLTVTAAPTINLGGTLSAANTTYGSASPAPTSFSVAAGALTGNLTVTAPGGFEVSSGGGYSTSLTLPPSGGAVGAGISVRLAATTAVGAYSGNVSVSGGGAGTQTIAVPLSTVAALGLTITGVSGSNKPYDRTTNASLTGTPVLNGVPAADAGKVAVSGTPSALFATAAAGTAKPVTVTGYTLSGSAATNYTLSQPTGVTADISRLALSVSGAAVTSKPYDGNTGATITGTLVGVLSPDVVTFVGTGTFANSAVGTGIAVTSTSTLGGTDAANYTLTQPTGLTGNITATSGVDLSRYVRIGRYDLPEPTRSAHPANSLLCQEASSVTYNWDTDTLFVVGDGGTSVVQVSKTGQLIDSMTLAPGNSPQGTTFYDTEGISYVGNGRFVLNEERDRQTNLFTYVAGGILTRADVKTVKLGTTIGNIGLEGVSFDPMTGGYIFVKEKDPESVFQTTLDFNAGTASNGSPTTTNSIDLFNPALVGTADLSDVFALSNLPDLNGQPDYSHLLVISQESGQIVNVDRSGTVYSRLTLVADPGNPLSIPDQTHEGVTMDRAGFLYEVSENGGGDSNHPQLWVFAPSTAPNLAPTAVTLNNAVPSIPENTSTAAHVKVAEIVVTDDGLGVNTLTVTGTDAAFFEIFGTGLYLKAGTTLSATNKPSYSVTVNVDDLSIGSTPDATATFTMAVTASTGGTPTLIISEVAAWSSGNSPLGADWFEVTNTGTATAVVTGWKMDDNSNSAGSAVPMSGIDNIAPGESVIFIELGAGQTASGNAAKFRSLWFGAGSQANLQIGSYTGSGVGLSTGGDAVNLYDAGDTLQANVVFGISPTGTFATFDNSAGLNNTTISALSTNGVNGAFVAGSDSHEIGSPGTIGASSTPTVTIVALDPNAAEAGSDPGTFRISRTGSTVGALTVSYSVATGSGQATSGDVSSALATVATIPSGQSFVDLTIVPVDDTIVEGTETVTLTLFDTGSYDVGTPSTATITITDDVQPPTVQAGILVTRGGFALDRLTGLYTQADTLKNNTASAIPGPIYLVLDTLSANATLNTRSGTTSQAAPLGSPYVLLVPPTGSLEPGASVTATLKFANPTRAGITYTTRILAGGNVAP